MSSNKSTDRVRHTIAVVHPNAAAIDVGATMHMAAVNQIARLNRYAASVPSRLICIGW